MFSVRHSRLYWVKKSNNNPPIHVYTSKVNYRLVFKIKDGYKLEIQTPPTMTLFGSKKNVNRQKKEWRKLKRS